MKTKFLKELPILLIALAPLTYILLVWNTLPNEVPLHYGMNGKADRYGDRYELLILSFALPALIYLIFTVIPFIDPKGKIKAMGNKYYRLKFIIVLFISCLTCFMVYDSIYGNESSAHHMIFVLVGLLFSVLGNYFQSVRPNYFIGIRTPWTLENETVWKDTHQLAGKLWMPGGLLIVALNLLLDPALFMYFFLGITTLIVMWPVIYSYLRFKTLKSSVSKG